FAPLHLAPDSLNEGLLHVSPTRCAAASFEPRWTLAAFISADARAHVVSSLLRALPSIVIARAIDCAET
ncbi:MAG: hypothetical protein KK478_24070, partial [Ensifer alkalisoli]|nr:hypothetical protein [Sinorhizobium alkalisoli]